MALPLWDRCPGPIDRRTWLTLGGLGLGALSSGAMPHLGQLLAAQQKSSAVNRDFSVILFFANGGPSHLDTFDLKPQATREIRGPYQPIATNVPGMEICELMPKLAQMAHRFSLIRSLHHERNEHSGGTHRLLTGYSSRQANLPESENPELGSIVAERLGTKNRDVPVFAADTKFYGGGPAYLGQSYAAYMPRPASYTASGNNRYEPVAIYNSNGKGDPLTISEEGVVQLRKRATLLNRLENLSDSLDRDETVRSFGEFQRQAVSMIAGSKTRAALDLNQESLSTRLRYGDTHWGRSLLACRRLVEAGVRFVQCQATYRLPKSIGVTSNWDDHSVNSNIFKAYDEKLPHLDHSLSALVEDLYERGLDQNVLLIFCGEFGRTPRIRNQDKSGRPGRDHWARAMSIFVAGGGLKMGQVIGATNSRAEEPVERAMNSNCLLATIYHKFGIDPHHMYHDRSGRPLPLLPTGEPIAELL